MHDVIDLALSLMEGLDCPRSLAVAILLKNREYAQVVRLRADVLHYNSSDDYYKAAVATDFLRKLDGLPTGIDKEQSALDKWWASERRCYSANQRISALYHGGLRAPCDEHVAQYLRKAKKCLIRLIGVGPSDDLHGRFGPGATMSDKASACLVPDKMSSRLTMTPPSFSLMPVWIQTAWGRAHAEGGFVPFEFVRGNTFFTVPKDSTTNRSCGKEPSFNVFYQLAYGRQMRKRLYRHGFDLDDNKTIHMRVACEASKTLRGLATIDLSSASDTICRALVKALLPKAWYDALTRVVSPFTKVKGKWVLLEKFSSMGNGFTFELQTAIFASLLMAMDDTLVPGLDLFVHGDDIIVPDRLEEQIKAVFTYVGFELNANKTFFVGAFRESCGGDYYAGQVVRPYYVKELPNEPQHFISIANGIRRLTCRDGKAFQRLPALRRTWFRVLDHIPSAIRSCRGPEDLGDLVVHDYEERWNFRWRSSIRYVRVYRPARFKRVSWDHWKPEIQFAAALYGVTLGPTFPYGKAVQIEEYDRYLVPRDAVTGYKVGWSAFS